MTWMTTCARSGCDRRPKARGYCASCYSVLRKQGAFEIPPRMSASERFWSKVEKTETCWLWRAGIHYSGYGHFNPTPKTTYRAHRFAYEQIVGPIPDGLVLDHLCRVRHCVNPAHLEPVTSAENVRRGVHLGSKPGRKGGGGYRPGGGRKRQQECSKGHQDWATKAPHDETAQRFCRTCRDEWLSQRDRSEEYEVRRAEAAKGLWAQVRTWAQENGYAVGKQGPLPNRVIRAYRAANFELPIEEKS